jgi:hypothetical protein
VNQFYNARASIHFRQGWLLVHTQMSLIFVQVREEATNRNEVIKVDSDNSMELLEELIRSKYTDIPNGAQISRRLFIVLSIILLTCSLFGLPKSEVLGMQQNRPD